jgi:hypothetical protein
VSRDRACPEDYRNSSTLTIISGKDGNDAKPYQEKDVIEIIKKMEHLEQGDGEHLKFAKKPVVGASRSLLEPALARRSHCQFTKMRCSQGDEQ